VDGTFVYCSADKTGLQTVRLADGAQLWKAKGADGSSTGFAAVAAAGGAVYGSDGSASVSAWDAASGALLWTCRLPQIPSETRPVVVKDTLFVPGRGSEGVHAVDTRTGQLRWTFQTTPYSDSYWLLSTDGQRLFAKTDSTVFALPPA
jgi:outer membrane protein assembly factor BamB